ncbi:MAG: sporulation protein [Oligoflexia bacterium]|nr:sporulation protein [Oligoflexia bacterium]
MKGTFIKQNLEFVLNTNGENWIQGDKVSGSIALKNRNGGSSPENVEGALRVVLCYGDFKKVHSKSKNAWTVIDQFKTEKISNVNPGEILEHKFEFKLAIDAPITDKGGSIYLLYGMEENLEELSHLQLLVDHNLMIAFFLETVERFLRFKIKQKKFNKSGSFVDVKLEPPATRELSSIDTMVCSLKIEENRSLKVVYQFSLKTLDIVSGGQAELQKKKREFVQELLPSDYCIYGNSPNYDVIKVKFQEIIKEIIPRLL